MPSPEPPQSQFQKAATAAQLPTPCSNIVLVILVSDLALWCCAQELVHSVHQWKSVPFTHKHKLLPPQSFILSIPAL
jgi:hypothetical protein